MMRWGRKKPASSGSSSSGLSRAFPVSWLSKFKSMNVAAGSDARPAKEKKQDEAWQDMSASFLPGRESNRHVCESGNNFQRLPIWKENAPEMLEWYELVGKLDFPAASLKTRGTNAGRLSEIELGKKFDDMMNKGHMRREFHRAMGNSLDTDVWEKEKEAVIMTPRLKFDKDEKKWMRKDQRLLEQKLQRSEGKEKHTEVKAAKSAKRSRDSRATIQKDSVFLGQNPQMPTHQWQKLKETKLKEVKLKAEQQRKSMYISRELSRQGTKQNSGVRVFSPRAFSRSEKCRVKAIEDLKKARLRTREYEERPARGIWKESFAVVKCSCDPQKDFRDSMIEMITENGISGPEELKELLVCYLTLNSDEYHEMIIKVFREVWVDMKHQSYNTKMQSLHDSLF